MNRYAIIVAGGTGIRMGSELPKQFLSLVGKPLIAYSIEAFFEADPNTIIIVVLHPRFIDKWELVRKEIPGIPYHLVVGGGETRFHSVKNGLECIKGTGLVAIHDAARPMITKALINSTFEEAAKSGNAIPALPVYETVRSVENNQTKIIDRSFLRVIQTPQVFETELIKEAYNQAFRADFTDDGSLLEANGQKVNLVKGDLFNFKITLPDEFELAEMILSSRR